MPMEMIKSSGRPLRDPGTWLLRPACADRPALPAVRKALFFFFSVQAQLKREQKRPEYVPREPRTATDGFITERHRRTGKVGERVPQGQRRTHPGAAS